MILVAVCLGMSPVAARAQSALPTTIKKTMQESRIPQNSVSIYIHRIGEPGPRLAWLDDVPRNPASTIKLLTTFAALELLGPDFTWKTEVYTQAAPEHETLNGNLYLKGYGDPYLVSEQFWRLLREVRYRGLKRINGDLVLDDTYFETEAVDPGGFDGQPHRSYNVAPSAFMLNFQSVNFLFRPGPDNQSVQIVADPDPGLQIVNRLKVGKGGCRNWKSRVHMDVANGKDDVIRFSGRYDRACGDKSMYRVVTDSGQYIRGVFRSLWQELGGRFEGRLLKAPVPGSANLYFQKTSQPLPEIIRSINKYSNNVMTRQLLLTLAAERGGVPGTTEKGVAVIREWLAGRGLDDPGLVLDNGAGLSRETRISSQHMGRLLLAAYSSPRMPELMASLPIVGTDGTLATRFADSPATGRVHAKTGLLDDVRGLAGYVLDQHQQRWVVVILHNHASAPHRAGERLQSAVLSWIFSQASLESGLE
ncbi:MAG: D-alanyl-D-alanine carboxypeptidase/D-alanyl-D-alanine-endopeptidase [Gammaproteobacteria bacterium]|nr:D-alanyl-D-alanine carboxypeptidase/D-alanyl-D-alanine-endopeptidase [Gammaproteobacteria bacterium]